MFKGRQGTRSRILKRTPHRQGFVERNLQVRKNEREQSRANLATHTSSSEFSLSSRCRAEARPRWLGVLK